MLHLTNLRYDQILERRTALTYMNRQNQIT